MFKNYLSVAFRNLSRNKLYSFINIFGLAIALVIFVYSQLIADYEYNHDTFFPGANQIYAVYGLFQPNAGIGVRSSMGIHSRIAPLIEAEIPDVEATARLMSREYLVAYQEKKFYQDIRFADPAFLDIFKFDYLAGNAENPLDDPDGLIITETAARKFFNSDRAVGKVIRFNNKHDLHVNAVIADIPENSHFTSGIIMDQPLQMIGSTMALARLSDFKMEGDWDGMSMQDVTYVRLKQGITPEQVNRQLMGLYDRHLPEKNKQYLAAYELRSLGDLNLYIWEATGLPVITSIQVLGLLILIIAIINYTNLATAQVIGRTREVGMRRVLGASRIQLFTQFIAESTTISMLSLVIAVVIVLMTLPLVNDETNKLIGFSTLSGALLLPGYFIVTALVTGILAGWYPALLISRGQTSGLINGLPVRGKRAGLIRNIMLVIQFAIALFMIIAVAIIYAQNKRIESASEVFAKDRIVTLQRISRPEIKDRLETLRTEIEHVPGVEALALSSQVPFEQNHSIGKFSLSSGDDADSVGLYRISIDRNFLQAYDIPLVAGRNFSVDYTQDILVTNDGGDPAQDSVNVIVNEMALSRLKFDSPETAIGRRFFRLIEDSPNPEYHIIGVVSDVNFLGFHNEIKPIVFVNAPAKQAIASVRLDGLSISKSLNGIDETWNRLFPSYPVDRKFLEDHFNDVYKVFQGINIALAGFAVIALLVALTGMFGMVAFMAETRTREIGIRKVLGAGVTDIVRLLVWQFSRPVLIAIVIASPLTYLVAGLYLDFFADRADPSVTLYIIACSVVVFLAWGIISVHAVKVARTKPGYTLHYE